MTEENSNNNAFLFELYTATAGDTEAQISMFDIGTTLGLEKNDAGEIAQTLCIQGLAELKTLSGGIGITRQGLKELNISVASNSNLSAFTLGHDPVLEKNSPGSEAVNHVIEEIKKNMAAIKQPYPRIEEMIIDIKTIELQMLSPRPKTRIIREIFVSLRDSLNNQGQEELSTMLEAILSS
ncbi:MAG: hypothetical protein ABIJ59_15085 [Pseudomonadota bacterium]